MGRVQEIMRTTNGVTKSTTNTFDLAGNPTNILYYSTANVAFQYDGAGRATSAIDPNMLINFVKNVTYAPSGGVAGMVSGQATGFAGITTTNAYDRRFRLQLTSPRPRPRRRCRASRLGILTNSNVQQVVNNLDTTVTQTYAYDNMNRLISGQAANRWGNTYTYDAFGNLYQFNPIAGLVPQSFTATPTINNQLAATGLVYDGAGNMYPGQRGERLSLRRREPGGDGWGVYVMGTMGTGTG